MFEKKCVYRSIDIFLRIFSLYEVNLERVKNIFEINNKFCVKTFLCDLYFNYDSEKVFRLLLFNLIEGVVTKKS